MTQDQWSNNPAKARKRSVIAMLGGECTGKTSLAQALSVDFKIGYIPEVLRDFVDQCQRSPRVEEQDAILSAQCDAIGEALSELDPGATGPILICDPSPWMTAIYSLQYFGDQAMFAKAQALMLALANAHQFNWFHLHCADDIVWRADGLQRDGPSHRANSLALIEQYPPLRGFAGHDRVEFLQGGLDERRRVSQCRLDDLAYERIQKPHA